MNPVLHATHRGSGDLIVQTTSNSLSVLRSFALQLGLLSRGGLSDLHPSLHRPLCRSLDYLYLPASLLLDDLSNSSLHGRSILIDQFFHLGPRSDKVSDRSVDCLMFTLNSPNPGLGAAHRCQIHLPL
ncbi:hypothetical protein D3C87_1724520 [compost metagenome]